MYSDYLCLMFDGVEHGWQTCHPDHVCHFIRSFLLTTAYAAVLPLQGKKVLQFLVMGKVSMYGEKHDAIALKHIDYDARVLAEECKCMHIPSCVKIKFHKIWDVDVVHRMLHFETSEGENLGIWFCLTSDVHR